MFELKLGGHEHDNPDDPFLLGASIVDNPMVPGPLAKHRREDLQLFSALGALSLKGFTRSPLNVEVGQDPPDRWLVHGDRRWATELTELTVEDVRQTISPPRMFARQLSAHINADLDRYPHLRDRIVVLSCNEDVTIPKQAGPLLGQLAQDLTVDVGYVGEGLDLSNGFPQQLPLDRGHHGQHGPFSVTVQVIDAGGAAVISASVQTRIKRSEAIAALAVRVAAKDQPTNDVLLVTCGMPDPQGYICSVDSSIFHLLHEGQRDGVDAMPDFLQLTHVRSVVLHLWNTPHFIVWGKDLDLPWVLPQTT